ncbi:hypothetical protein, partial [Aeromonas caviae]|uniref:hypothetical protein n=1 Tax=Aeromonas caviae TaxID=648 RepID=UPI002B4A1D5A
ATNQIAQTGLSSLPPVIYYSEQLFRYTLDSLKKKTQDIESICFHILNGFKEAFSLEAYLSDEKT